MAGDYLRHFFCPEKYSLSTTSSLSLHLLEEVLDGSILISVMIRTMHVRNLKYYILECAYNKLYCD